MRKLDRRRVEPEPLPGVPCALPRPVETVARDREAGARKVVISAPGKKEDITINLQIMRKVGIISASYRLVEARTGKVIATGSETTKAEFTDEGNEGIELGQFRMPFKLASLPADTEILQKLTDKISDVIGEKLVQELKEPEKRYAETAKRYSEEADPVMAAENQAYAFALANLKGQDTTPLRLALEQYALKAP